MYSIIRLVRKKFFGTVFNKHGAVFFLHKGMREFVSSSLTRFLHQPFHFLSPCPVSLHWFSRIQKKNMFMFLNCATFGKYVHPFFIHTALFLLPFLSCSGKNWLQKIIVAKSEVLKSKVPKPSPKGLGLTLKSP